MRCEELEAIIFSGREITAEERAEMEAHAETCEACRALMDNADALRGMQRIDEDVTPPESFTRSFLYVRERKVVINRYFPSVFIPPFAHDALCIAISCGRERKVVCEWRLQPADVPLFCSRPLIIAPEPLFLRRILPTFGSVG